MKPSGNDLSRVVGLALDAERQAADRLRAAEARLVEAQARLAAVARYVSEYHERASVMPTGAARRVLDERRFLVQLQQTLAAQSRITDQDHRHAELVRGHWLAARRKRQGLEQLVAERQQQARLLAEQSEQQALDDRPRLRGGGRLAEGGPQFASLPGKAAPGTTTRGTTTGDSDAGPGTSPNEPVARDVCETGARG